MKRLIFLLIPIMAFALSYKSQAQTSTVNEEIAKAQTLAQQGKTEEASKIYISLMENHPDNREAVRGWIIANMKRTPTGEEEMIGQLDGLEKLYPKNSAVLFFKAYIQGEYKHYEESLLTIDKLIRIQPDSALNWGFKGGLLSVMNKYKEAISSYNRAISLNPQLREWAPKDEDFKSLWDDEDFKKLTLQGLL